jgi:hypothetical protein
MTKAQKIQALSQLGAYIQAKPDALNETVEKAYYRNRWFTPDNTWRALQSIASKMLDDGKLEKWIARYHIPDHNDYRRVGLVLAGNLPLVGFHDVLSTMMAGHCAVIKMSSKDKELLPHLLDRLVAIDAGFAAHFEVTERLADLDAVIATGSNNTARYFEYYFGKYPNIIRKNRNSVAILTGHETAADYLDLGKDVFSFFGMGCRNVSKLYIPAGFDPAEVLDGLEPFGAVMEHDKYRNNYDYHRSILLLNQDPHLASDFLMLLEKEAIASPMASLHYEFYEDKTDLQSKLNQHKNEIQVIASNDEKLGHVPLGKTQEPELWDYADGVDTMAFLLNS